MKQSLERIIHAVAPTRIGDVGGWTDTWFAEHGSIFNISVSPLVEVQIRRRPLNETKKPVVIRAENYREVYEFDPVEASGGKHPLIEAAITEMDLPQDVGLEVSIYSSAPPGASMGTSAAVSVALIGALDALTPGRMTPVEIARFAHRLETQKLNLECGVQDQIASACGGINLIHMPEYPQTEVTPISVSEEIYWELEQRLLVVYIGKPHQSSEVHRAVIKGLGERPKNDVRLAELRSLSQQAATALERGNFEALGDVFHQNTEVQRRLHPDLVCSDFEKIISLASAYDAEGCKVNGAGGDGGSVTILCSADLNRKRELESELHRSNFRCLPVLLSSQGLRVWEST